MLKMLVDDHFPAEQIAMGLAKALQFMALADQLDTHRQMRIG